MLLVHNTARRKTSFVILACLVVACFVSLTSQAKAEGGSQHVNVELFFGYHWPDHSRIENKTTVYNSQHEWARTTQDSRLVLKDGRVGLELLKGEKIISAEAAYGTIHTHVYLRLQWFAARPLPLYKILPDDEGNTWKIPLTDISIDAYNPQLPLPEVSKGTGVVSEEPSGEMK